MSTKQFFLVQIHSQRSRENMHLLKIFDVCPRDELFDEVVGISNKQMERGVCGSEVWKNSVEMMKKEGIYTIFRFSRFLFMLLTYD